MKGHGSEAAPTNVIKNSRYLFYKIYFSIISVGAIDLYVILHFPYIRI